MENFKYLHELISNNLEIVLESDIRFEGEEELQNGIKLERDNILIDGAGHSIDGDESSKIFDIAGSNITLKNIVFKNSKGAITTHGNNLKIINCEFLDNKSSSGAAVMSFEPLKITDSKFKNNSAEEGGAIMAIECELEIRNCEFNKNKSNEGGAIKNFALSGGGLSFILGKLPRLRIFDSIFKENESGQNYGAISTWGVLALQDCIFENNVSAKNGGAVGINGNANAMFTRCEFTNNNAKVAGAVINFSVLLVNECVFKSNNAYIAGGAICNEPNTFLEISDTLFVNNHSDESGGAIASAWIIKMGDCSFINNTAKVCGAVLDCEDKEISFNNVEFEENSSGDESVITTKSPENLKFSNSELDEKYIKHLKDDY